MEGQFKTILVIPHSSVPSSLTSQTSSINCFVIVSTKENQGKFTKDIQFSGSKNFNNEQRDEYKMGHTSFWTKYKWSSSLRDLFVPRDFPYSVTKNYLPYSVWHFLHITAGTVTGGALLSLVFLFFFLLFSLAFLSFFFPFFPFVCCFLFLFSFQVTFFLFLVKEIFSISFHFFFFFDFLTFSFLFFSFFFSFLFSFLFFFYFIFTNI